MFRPETDWLRKWALYTPRKMMLRDYQRDLRWTYHDMDRRVSALARHLHHEYNLKKGNRIAVYSKNRSEYVFLFLACVRLGVILVPLNFRLTPRELDVLVHDSDPRLLVFEKSLIDHIQSLNALHGIEWTLEIETLDHFLTESVRESTFTSTDPITFDDLVMILYTAGTTGLPKGAMITHRMLFWNSVNTTLRLDLTSEDHTQSYAPFFHTGGWNVLFTPLLHAGASQTLLGGFDPDLLLQLMEEEKTTLFFGVPTMLQMMADSPSFERVNLTSVRYAIVGGAPMPIPLINAWHKKGVLIRQGYGLTEVGPNCFSLHQDDAIRKQGSIGFPNFYMEARIVGRRGTDCEPGEVGELWLRSEVVTPGYWRNQKETVSAITDGWFHTGDMVQRDAEGFFYVVDRKKNMFISGGENIYPAEIEAVLVTHTGVKEVAVIGVADEKWGEVGKAFVALEHGQTATRDQILAFCQGKLAKYKIPKHVAFVDVLPRNEAGKIDRSKLREASDSNQEVR